MGGATPKPGAIRKRREPKTSALYGVLQEHLATFLAEPTEESGPGLPVFVRRELHRYLDRGILAHGFARVHCASCGRDELVAFSRKGRGFCPSCCGRRMADTAAHLVNEVLPRVPVRQWVLSLPFRIRYLLAYDARICSEGSCSRRYKGLALRNYSASRRSPWPCSTAESVTRSSITRSTE